VYILKLSYEKNDIRQNGEFFSGFGMAYRTDYEIFEPVLETQVNSVGHFSFTVYPTHPLYEFVDQPKALLEIVRYGFDEPLFIGRMAECVTGLYNEKMLTFESELAFLLDSARTNFASGTSDTAAGWLKRILEYHNSHADNFGTVYTVNIQRKFETGKVSEAFASETVQPSAEEFKGTFSTLELIFRLLIEKYGGVLKMRHENGINYIDWLDEGDLHVSSQKIELSKNLISIEGSRTTDELLTVIRPVGDNVSTTDGESVPLDIRLFDASPLITDSDVKQVINPKVSEASDLKFTDVLYSESLVRKYGWIQREVTFSGVNNKATLVRRAVKYLQNMSAAESITINAVDLSRKDNSIENFIAGDYAVVNSSVHSFANRKMLISSVCLNLADPTAGELTLGSEGVTITSQLGRSGGVSFSGSVSAGGGGRYDPEGSASSALTAAKEYTDSVSAQKVDKQTGKSLSTNDFTDDYKSQVDTNTSDISALKTKTDTTNSDISALTAEVGKKAASADVYTKAQTDSRITEKVSEIVADAPEEFNTLREMSDWLLQHAESAAAMNTAITQNAADILALAEKTDAEKLDIASRNYVPIRYVSGAKDFNTDFQITAEEAAKVIFVNPNKDALSDNAPFSGSECRSYTVAVERLYGNGDLEYVLKQTCVSVQFPGTEHAKVYEHQRFYIKSTSTRWTDWEECGKTADDTMLGMITQNADDIAINKATLGYQRKNLFNPNAVNWYKPTATSIADDGAVVSAVTYDSRSWGIANAEYFLTLQPGKYIVKTETSARTDVAGKADAVRGYNESGKQVFAVTAYEEGVKTFSFTISTAATIGIMFKLFTQTCRIMIYNADVYTDDTYEPYADDVITRFERFEQQPLLYSSTITEESPLTVNIPGLFRNYSAVICQMYTSNYTDKFNLTLPLKYIKSLGTGSYYSAENQLLFEYVDDDNLCVRTGMGQSNPTMSGVKIIALY